MELGSLVVGVQSPNHWTTREFPFIVMLKQMKNGKLEGAEARRRLLQWSRRKTMEAVIVGKKKKRNELIQEMFWRGKRLGCLSDTWHAVAWDESDDHKEMLEWSRWYLLQFNNWATKRKNLCLSSICHDDL